MTQVIIPTFDKMMNPVLQVLRNLGGSGTIKEIDDEVASLLQLRDDQLELLHNPDKSSQTEVAYRLAWTRTYLKKVGLLENSKRGVWALTAVGRDTRQVDPVDVSRTVRQELSTRVKTRKKQDAISAAEGQDEAILGIESLDETQSWREELFEILHQMPPAAFERLSQQILREDGFTQVDVTGRSGDGGIDGVGIVRIGGFLSFRVLFQCKRYKGSIGAGVVRDFRGAMVGRTDKGLIVSTGYFTQAAIREATRDGAPEIDLLDGEQLIDKLKELELGVETEKVVTEQVTVYSDFFSGI